MKQTRSSQQPESELKRLRERAGLSQTALARLIGVTAKTVSNWEKGITPTRNLTTTQVKDLCGVLGVTQDELPQYLGSVEIDE